jgi:hypothetical protein
MPLSEPIPSKSRSIWIVTMKAREVQQCETGAGRASDLEDIVKREGEDHVRGLELATNEALTALVGSASEAVVLMVTGDVDVKIRGTWERKGLL